MTQLKRPLKIGVVGCFFGSADILSEVLAPWIALKREGYPIVLTGINAQFKEYAELGYTNDDDATRAVLEEHRHDFDHLVIEKTPLMEHEVRNRLLELCKAEGVDAIWLLDGDELYTLDQIKKILAYVEAVPFFDYYHIFFQNILFDTLRSRDMFAPPRIVRMDRHGGVMGFTWDNEIRFRDGTHLYRSLAGSVPPRIALVKHLTWRTADALKKIDYSKRHFGFSIFKQDEATGEIGYNEEWFRHYEMPVPRKYPDGSVGTPVPVLEVYVSLEVPASPLELSRTLWSLIRALLELERANEVELMLVVCSIAAVPEQVRTFLAMFSVSVRYESGSPRECARSSSADLFFFTDSRVLFHPSALLEMFLDQRTFARLSGSQVGISLVDDRARYSNEEIEISRVVTGGSRHWRTIIRSSARALMVPRESLRLVEGAATIDWKAKLLLFSPIPSLAIPLDGTMSDQPPFAGEQKLWQDLENMPETVRV